MKLFKARLDNRVAPVKKNLRTKKVNFKDSTFYYYPGRSGERKSWFQRTFLACWATMSVSNAFCRACKQTQQQSKKHTYPQMYIHTYAHLKISLSINKVLNSSEELMHTLSRAEVNWSHELINTANDWPHLIKDRFTVSIIWAQLLQLPPDLLTATSSQLKSC